MRANAKAAGDDAGDNMAAGVAVGFFRAAAKVQRAGGHEDAADRFDEFADDHTFCLAVARRLMEDAKE